MAKANHQLYFSRLKLTNWRNFTTAEVHLRRRVFLIGPNASGKSNLLDSLRFLRDLVAVGGGLQSAVKRRGNMLGVRCLYARRPAFVEIEVDLGNDATANAWTYRIRFNKDKQGRPVIEQEEVRKQGAVLPSASRPTPADRADPELLSQTYLEQTIQNREFRELAEFFGEIRYLHVVPQIVRDPRRHLPDDEDPFGGDLLKRINATTAKTRDPRLRQIARALTDVVPQFEDLTIVRGEDDKPHLEAAFRHWRPSPTRVSEEKFSDGTLRLIGLLWSIAERGGPLLLEEPELSLNDQIVRALGESISRMQGRSGRQVIITTHSEALLSSEGIAPDEVHSLKVTQEGTVIETAIDDPSIVRLAEAGLTMGEAALPRSRPDSVDQLSLFDAAN